MLCYDKFSEVLEKTKKPYFFIISLRSDAHRNGNDETTYAVQLDKFEVLEPCPILDSGRSLKILSMPNQICRSRLLMKRYQRKLKNCCLFLIRYACFGLHSGQLVGLETKTRHLKTFFIGIYPSFWSASCAFNCGNGN